MKEVPISFSDQMILAYSYGQKHMTRRIVRDENKCPYRKGDKLWFREAWRTLKCWDALTPSALPSDPPVRYGADGWVNKPGQHEWGRYRHPRFMPRALSRFSSMVLSVRTEPVNSITEDDAEAEGVSVASRAIEPWYTHKTANCIHCGRRKSQHVGVAEVCVRGMGTLFDPKTYRGGFVCLWESIHGAGSWERNDDVWVVEFERR